MKRDQPTSPSEFCGPEADRRAAAVEAALGTDAETLTDVVWLLRYTTVKYGIQWLAHGEPDPQAAAPFVPDWQGLAREAMTRVPLGAGVYEHQIEMIGRLQAEAYRLGKIHGGDEHSQ